MKYLFRNYPKINYGKFITKNFLTILNIVKFQLFYSQAYENIRKMSIKC